MAIIDVFERVSENQALTGGGVAGNFLSRPIDLSPSGVIGKYRDVGRGNELAFRVQVTEAFGGGDATALNVTVIVNDDGSENVLALANTINLVQWNNITAVLTLGAVFTIPVPTIPQHMIQSPAGEPGRRYLSLLYTATGGTGNYGTGKVTCDFGHWRDTAQPSIHKIGYAGP